MTEIDTNTLLQGVSAVAAAALGLVVRSLYSSIKDEAAARKEADEKLDKEIASIREDNRDLERSLVAKISQLITKDDLRAEVDRLMQFLSFKHGAGE